MTPIRLFACMLGLASLAGCGTLDPYVVPATTPLSTIAQAPGSRYQLSFLCIDGRSTSTFSGLNRHIAMLPAGRHHVVMEAAYAKLTAVDRQVLEVVEGHRYAVATKVVGYEVQFAFIDEVTGLAAGKPAGAGDEPSVQDSACKSISKTYFSGPRGWKIF